jgi:hypothetical protein
MRVDLCVRLIYDRVDQPRRGAVGGHERKSAEQAGELEKIASIG